jgi:phosphonatase-like hydrolase
MQLPQLVVFDLAGTTVQDGGQVPAAFTAALAEHGLDVSPAQVEAVRGASKKQAILQLVPDSPDRASRADRMYATFKEEVARRFAADVRAVPGAAETLAWLRASGVRVALNTGFDRDITSLLLAALGWDKGQADAVVCGDDVTLGRPAPQLIFRAMEATQIDCVRNVAVVGDTMLDLQAGYNAGVRWNIGVLSGAHNHSQLQSQPHTHLILSVADLPSIWSSEAQSPYVASSRELPEETFEWGTLKWLSNQALSTGAEQTLGLCHIHAGRRNPVHYHPNCEEVLYMLSGSGVHSYDGRLIEISAGMTLRVPAHVKHNLQNTGPAPIVCLIAFSSGRRETVFLE